MLTANPVQRRARAGPFQHAKAVGKQLALVKRNSTEEIVGLAMKNPLTGALLSGKADRGVDSSGCLAYCLSQFVARLNVIEL